MTNEVQSRNKIVLGEGTDVEKVIFLQRPKGRKAREMMPKVLDFMSKLERKANEQGLEQNAASVVLLLQGFWGDPEFEDVLLPYVLQLDDEAGRAYLDEEGLPGEIMEAFSKAAQFLIEESFHREEVQEALGKSNDEQEDTSQYLIY